MKQRMTFFMTDQEHAALSAYSAKSGLSMSRIIGKAVRAVTSGTIEVGDDCVIVKQSGDTQHMFRMLNQTPTNVSRETPVPDAPEDTTEYKVNPLVKPDAPDRFRTNDDGVSFDYMYIPEKPISGGKK